MLLEKLNEKVQTNDEFLKPLMRWNKILDYITTVLKFFCRICKERNRTSIERVDVVGLDKDMIESVIRAKAVHKSIKT